MSFKSVLATIGKDVVKVVAWIGSPSGQVMLSAGEGVAAEVFPQLSGLVFLANGWIKEIVKTEALFSAAGQQNGSGTQKASVVLSTVTPEVLAFAKEHGLAVPTADKLAAANTALVTFLNCFEVGDRQPVQQQASQLAPPSIPPQELNGQAA